MLGKEKRFVAPLFDQAGHRRRVERVVGREKCDAGVHPRKATPTGDGLNGQAVGRGR